MLSTHCHPTIRHAGMIALVRATIVFLVLLSIRCYQCTIRPLLAGACKVHPSCSGYACEAFCMHGLWRGLCLSLRRLLRCHPFGVGGYDPVPDAATQCAGDTATAMRGARQ